MVRQVEVLWCSFTMMSSPTSSQNRARSSGESCKPSVPRRVVRCGGAPARCIAKVTLPGYGPDVAANRGEARKLMAKHGYTGRTTDEIRACNQHRWSARPNHPTNDPRPRRRGHRVNRRAIVALALGLCVWSLSADAQQPTKIPLVGILSDETSVVGAKSFEPFAVV